MYEKLMTFFASIRFEWLVKLFKEPSYLTKLDRLEIMDRIVQNDYIIATKDPYSLSGFFVRFAHWFLTGHRAHYTHVFIKTTDDLGNIIFVEATSKGVHISDFHEVFKHAQNAALLYPKYYTRQQFNVVAKFAVKLVGKGYDFGYNLNKDDLMSCVEVDWTCLKQLPDWEKELRCLKFLMEYERNLTPDMYVEVPDMAVELEIKR